MKRKTITALIAALTIASLTACGGPKQLSKSVTVELGDEKGINVTDILDISKDKAKDAKLNTKDVNFYKVGKYDATITYDKKDYKVTVKIKDSIAPEVKVKDEIIVQTGNPVRVTDCLDNVTEASGIIDAKFKDKPEAADTSSTESEAATENSTESVDATESTEESSVSSSEQATDSATSSSVYAVGDVSLSSNDEITYPAAGDYDNSIIVTDTNGNETTVDVKISVIDAPVIEGVADKTVTVGDTIDYMAGVTAKDGKGEDLTGSVEVDSTNVKTDTAGSYQATYKVTDKYGLTSGTTSNVTVNEKPAEEPKQEVADNSSNNSSSSSNSNGSSDKKNNGSSSSGKKHNSSSSSSSDSSSSGGNSSSNSSSGSSGGGSGSSSSSSSGSNSSGSSQPAQSEGDYVTNWDGSHLSVDRSKWKYDLSEASRLGSNGYWANGDPITKNDIWAAGDSSFDANAAKYMQAAGYITYLDDYDQ